MEGERTRAARENCADTASEQITCRRAGAWGACGWRGGARGPRGLGTGRRQRSIPRVCLLTQESEQLRLTAFEVCASLLARVKRRNLVFPLRHQLLNLTVPLVLHLGDVSVSVAQVRGQPWPAFAWEENAKRLASPWEVAGAGLEGAGESPHL